MPSEYDSGYNAGFRAGLTFAGTFEPQIDIEAISNIANKKLKSKKMGRPKLSPRQKLLTQMTKTKWAKYKRGSGKKTYVDIRAQVSRSAEYKRKAKRL